VKNRGSRNIDPSFKTAFAASRRNCGGSTWERTSCGR
jgi:hypothetical protein